MKKTKANNYGKGFWYEYEDGCQGWVLSMSAAEKREGQRIHGKLIKWITA